MIEKVSESQIKDLTINFFKIIDANIEEDNGKYHITVPDSYRNIFGVNELFIKFVDTDSEEKNYELMVPGNPILVEILNICANKGPISEGIIENQPESLANQRMAIRYFFHVNFAAIKTFSKLSHVDIKLDQKEVITSNLKIIPKELGLINNLNPNDISYSYLTALDRIKKDFQLTEKEFLSEASQKFHEELNYLNVKYEDKIQEIEADIAKKDKKFKETTYQSNIMISDNDEENMVKNYDYRFEGIDQISGLRKDLKIMQESLSKKHRVIIEYQLVASILFMTN